MEGLLPVKNRRDRIFQLFVGIADVFEDHRIRLRNPLRRSQQLPDRLMEFPLAERDPAQRVEVGSVVGIGVEGAPDELLRLVKIFVPFGPHVAKVITGARGLAGIEFDRFAQKFDGFDRLPGLLGRSAVTKIKITVQKIRAGVGRLHIGPLEGLDRLFVPPCLAQGHGPVKRELHMRWKFFFRPRWRRRALPGCPPFRS